jgi:hypothetical protein
MDMSAPDPGSGEAPWPAVPLLTGQTTEKTDYREHHLTLRQTAGKQSLTRQCPTRLDISPRSACVYRLVVNKYAAPDPGGAGITGLAVS